MKVMSKTEFLRKTIGYMQTKKNNPVKQNKYSDIDNFKRERVAATKKRINRMPK